MTADTAHAQCPGTWIAHRDRTGTCTVEDCTTAAEAHDLVIDCAELVPVYTCLPSEHTVEKG